MSSNEEVSESNFGWDPVILSIFICFIRIQLIYYKEISDYIFLSVPFRPIIHNHPAIHHVMMHITNSMEQSPSSEAKSY